MTKTSILKSPKHRYNLRLLNHYCNEKASDKGLPSQSTLKLEDKVKTPKNVRELTPRYSSRLKEGQSSKKPTIATFIKKKTSATNQKLQKKVLQNNISKSYKKSASSSKKLTLPNESDDKFQRNSVSVSKNINSPNDLSMTHKCPKKQKVKSDNGLPSQSTLKLEDKVKTPKTVRELTPRYSSRLKEGQSSKKTTIATFIEKKTSATNQKVLQNNISKSYKNSASSSKKLTLPNESDGKFQRNSVSFSKNINSPNDLSMIHKCPIKQKVKSDNGLPSQSTLKLEDKVKTPKNVRELTPKYSLRLKEDQSSKKTTTATLIKRKTSTSNQKLEKKVLQNNISKSYKNCVSSSKKLTLANESDDKFQRNSASFSENINTPNDMSMTHKCPKKQKVKSDGFKKFHKSTLKRKKSAIEAVIKADENYEDDLYESKKFDQFRELLMDSPNSEKSFSISPPEFPVTPIIRNETPEFKDCFSPEEYEISRKAAMEYMYRNQRRGSCPEPP